VRTVVCIEARAADCIVGWLYHVTADITIGEDRWVQLREDPTGQYYAADRFAPCTCSSPSSGATINSTGVVMRLLGHDEYCPAWKRAEANRLRLLRERAVVPGQPAKAPAKPKRVVCFDNRGVEGCLTVGKSYEVSSESEVGTECVNLVDDQGHTAPHEARLFMVCACGSEEGFTPDACCPHTRECPVWARFAAGTTSPSRWGQPADDSKPTVDPDGREAMSRFIAQRLLSPSPRAAWKLWTNATYGKRGFHGAGSIGQAVLDAHASEHPSALDRVLEAASAARDQAGRLAVLAVDREPQDKCLANLAREASDALLRFVRYVAERSEVAPVVPGQLGGTILVAHGDDWAGPWGVRRRGGSWCIIDGRDRASGTREEVKRARDRLAAAYPEESYEVVPYAEEAAR
jgi:hypothetical protein